MQVTVNIKFLTDDQTFVFKEDITGDTLYFGVGAMQRFAKEYGGRCSQVMLVRTPVDSNAVAIIGARGGIDQERMDKLPDEALREPIIGIQWDDGTVTIIDGNHRLLKLFQRNVEMVNMYLFTDPFWRSFLQDGLSGGEHFLKKHYGEKL